MAKFLGIGDPHLGKSVSLGKQGIGTSLNSRIVDQVNLLEWSLETAILEECTHIVVFGDVFEDPKPATYLITLFISWLKKCQSNSIQVHVIVGNHDVLRTGDYYYSPLDIISEADLEGIHIHNDINTFFIENTGITIIPFRDRKSLKCEKNEDAKEFISNCINVEHSSIPSNYHKVVVGHLMLEGSVPIGDEIDDMANEIICDLDFFKSYDFTWMGHIHKAQVMSEKPFIAHIGSMDISNFGEADQTKHVVVFDCINGSFKTIDLPTRKLNKVNITIPEDEKDPTEFILKEIEKQEISKSILRLEINNTSDSLPIDKKKIEEALYSKGVFNVSGLSETKKSKIIKSISSEIDNKMDVASVIRKYADNVLSKENVDKKDLFISTALSIFKELKSGDK